MPSEHTRGERREASGAGVWPLSRRVGSLGILLPAFVLLPLPGCGGGYDPALRKTLEQNADLRRQVDDLKRQHDADAAQTRGLREQLAAGRPALATLPPERLDQLFTTHGIRLGRLTGAASLAAGSAGNDGLKVYVTPFDDAGETLKAAGTFVVEAFDLSAGGSRLGRWDFDARQTRDAWYGAFEHCYVLKCPWQKPPQHPEVTLKVTFVDGLTGRAFTEQKPIQVHDAVAPATGPTTMPATAPSTAAAAR